MAFIVVDVKSEREKKLDFLTAIGFIFTISAVVLSVTAQVYRDSLLPVSALKLARQADI